MDVVVCCASIVLLRFLLLTSQSVPPAILPLCCILMYIGFGKSDTPGPAYFIDSTMTRTGKDGTPHYSLYGRHKDLGRMNGSCDKV